MFGISTMSAYHTRLRPGNKALSYLISHSPHLRYRQSGPPNAKIQIVVDSLPKFADDLYSDAQDEARTILRSHTRNPITRVVRRTALAKCVFDLQMTAAFSEFAKHFESNDVASILVDTLIYQATGFEASSPTEEQLLLKGTQNTRGIHKFQVAHRTWPHIRDIESWVFGKEFSAIVSGSPMDIANVSFVAPFSLLIRFRAPWRIRYLLYGTKPTAEEEQALLTAIKEMGEKLAEPDYWTTPQ